MGWVAVCELCELLSVAVARQCMRQAALPPRDHRATTARSSRARRVSNCQFRFGRKLAKLAELEIDHQVAVYMYAP
jgi:hypothetical protein